MSLTSVAYGLFVMTWTWVSSTTVAPVTYDLNVARWVKSAPATMRSTAVFTSAAVNVVPSCIMTSSRSVNVHVSLSALIS